MIRVLIRFALLKTAGNAVIEPEDLQVKNRSVGFCRGSRVEGNMSRVEVEGRGRG